MRLMKLEQPLTRLRDQIDRLFEQPHFGAGDLFGGWTPAVDVLENKERFTVKAELPGYKLEDIDVSLQEDNLILSGERRSDEEHKEGEFCRSERHYGKFHRSIPLPSTVDAGGIEAKYRDGILTVTLPKTEKARGKQIEVLAG